jgi:subtilisin family serine protease
MVAFYALYTERKRMRILLILTMLLAGISSAGSITGILREEIALAGSDQLIPVLIKPVGRADMDYIASVAGDLTPAQRREFAVDVLKEFAGNAQQPLLNALESFPAGSVTEVRTNWIANVVGCYATPEVILLMASRNDVDWVALKTFEDILVEPVDVREPSNEELRLANAWGVDMINAPDVWALGYEGQGVIVSVVDTGVNYNHIDLQSQMWHDTAAGYHYGWDFADNDPDPMDQNGHGTHCAGSVASNGNAGTNCGVAPNATIMALRVGTSFSDEQDVWDAFEFSIVNGANVISTSLGWPQNQNPVRQTWREVEENVLAAGIHHSIAAGNEGGNPDTYGDIRTPGDCPPPWLHPDQTTAGGLSAVITVGATDINDNLAYFSSLGYSTWKFDAPWFDYSDTAPEIGLIDPDICGPGVDIVSCDYSNPSGYTTMSGTSMATPHLAGCMALMLSANPNLTNAQMDSLLEVTSVDLGAAGKDNYYGAGRVDIYQAVLGALELVAIEEESHAGIQPRGAYLSGVSPNPVVSQAGFSLYLPSAGQIELCVYDIAGRSVSTIYTGELASGSHSYLWTIPENMGNGLYFVRALTPGGTSVSRMTLVR